MEKSSSKTHTMRAMIELRQRIFDGSLAGGTRLFEVPLAEELGISRTPVREAMSRLAEEGLLDRAPGGGFLVRSFRFKDVVDAIELRGVLEGTAARLAAERGAEPAALKRIHKTLQALDRCFGTEPGDVDLDGYREFNGRFHQELAALSGSEVVQREIERVNRLPFASPTAFLPDRVYNPNFRTSLIANQAQHRAIVAAIEAREGARAEALAREHARAARTNLEYFVTEHGGLAGRVPGLALVLN
ncbi:GntR family transcriptional regulator [Chelativorans intermedius]|uniref:GntR family transcriptional regulator n=1 Tax=Chelativorans intermedius TaxID=515947 RepID=A0ABV6D5R9_9HYPH|nr:GntR family transcriptional regulator [Chelativorans intermedius]MCT8998860.1 GntR family transcriptional regulator [Chelativorans intermedius]